MEVFSKKEERKRRLERKSAQEREYGIMCI
jgi:hypothetical protein